MHPRFPSALRLTVAAALALAFTLAHAIPKAAEDENGTVEIVADVPRPKASAKTRKPAAGKPARSAKTNSRKSGKVGKSSPMNGAAKTKARKPVRGKK